MTNRLTLEALGTQWWIEAPQPLPEAAITELITTFERRYSRFKPDSELSLLNRDKQAQHPRPELVALVRYGLRMYAETEGVFNMSVGATLEQNGYGPEPDPTAHLSASLENDIRVSDTRIDLAPLVRLDFGGFGKGWLVDEVGKLLVASGITSYLVNGGGDIVVGQEAQNLFIEHPLNPGEYIGTVEVQNGALASSSDRKRRWTTKDGSLKTHIVDPRGSQTRPDRPLSVQVRAATALIADTLGTVFLLVSEDKRRELALRFQADYLVIQADLRYSHTPGFGFTANS